MKFLRCYPSVFVIGKSYEITLNAYEKGIFAINVGNKIYYEQNSGVLSSEKKYAKIRIPQKALDKYQEYRVIFRKTIERTDYFSKFEDEVDAKFSFKPLTKKNNINIYHIGDVHSRFDLAHKCASYFQDDLDILIVNGDICEVKVMEDYINVFKFLGDFTKGYLPIIFARGNHDTRGNLAEIFTDFFPSNNKKTFYKFTLGCLNGIVLDLGEDKVDSHPEYNNCNNFKEFRKEQLKFLKRIKLDNSKINFVVTHMSHVEKSKFEGCCFDDERPVYVGYNQELERNKIDFMLTAHKHQAYVLEANNEDKSLIKHNYPIIVGTACYFEEDLWGTAITIKDNAIIFKFTDTSHRVRDTFEIKK